MLYDPLRYGVLSSDDPYSVDVSIIIPLFILSSSVRRKDGVSSPQEKAGPEHYRFPFLSAPADFTFPRE